MALSIFLTALALVVFVFAVSCWMSPPWAGKKIARDRGMPYPAIVAHRGASYLAPESTLPAYLLARELGPDYLEMDVQRTKDGELIVFHDETLERVSDVQKIFPHRSGDPIGSFTFEELQKLDVGTWFNTRFPERARKSYENLKIPRLVDIVQIAEGATPKPGKIGRAHV